MSKETNMYSELSAQSDSICPTFIMSACQRKSWVMRESQQAFFVGLFPNIRSFLYVSFQKITFFDMCPTFIMPATENESCNNDA